MGAELSKAFVKPVAQMWHDCCALCCDNCTFESDCGNCCRISVETRPHEIEEPIKDDHG